MFKVSCTITFKLTIDDLEEHVHILFIMVNYVNVDVKTNIIVLKALTQSTHKLKLFLNFTNSLLNIQDMLFSIIQLYNKQRKQTVRIFYDLESYTINILVQ